MKTFKEILEDQQAPVTALMYVITQTYGGECFDWEPEVLAEELCNDFSVELSDLQSDKLQAGITVLSTNMYEEDVRTFEVCSRLMSGAAQDFEDFEPLEAEELIAGMTEAMLLRMEKLDFSDAVEAYAGRVFYEYGFCKAPELFPTALMPKCNTDACSDNEKNEAMQEIFDEKLSSVKKYIDSIQQ